MCRVAPGSSTLLWHFCAGAVINGSYTKMSKQSRWSSAPLWHGSTIQQEHSSSLYHCTERHGSIPCPPIRATPRIHHPPRGVQVACARLKHQGNDPYAQPSELVLFPCLVESHDMDIQRSGQESPCVSRLEGGAVILLYPMSPSCSFVPQPFSTRRRKFFASLGSKSNSLYSSQD
jgi:hypothetical protein